MTELSLRHLTNEKINERNTIKSQTKIEYKPTQRTREEESRSKNRLSNLKHSCSWETKYAQHKYWHSELAQAYCHAEKKRLHWCRPRTYSIILEPILVYAITCCFKILSQCSGCCRTTCAPSLSLCTVPQPVYRPVACLLCTSHRWRPAGLDPGTNVLLAWKTELVS